MKYNSDYWVVSRKSYPAWIEIKDDRISLGNSLFERTGNIRKGISSLKNLTTDKEMLHAGACDLELEIDHRTVDLYQDLTFVQKDFIQIAEDVPWKREHPISSDYSYPPSGQAVRLLYRSENLEIAVIYEIFDDIPLYCKRVHIKNISERTVELNLYKPELLPIKGRDQKMIYIETDFTGGNGQDNGNRHLSSQKNEQSLFSAFDAGPDVDIHPGQWFTGFRTYVLLHSVEPYEQQMIECKEMMRRIAPWTNEVPLIMHMTGDNMRELDRVSDQCAAVGFDSLVQSFTFGWRRGIDQENESFLNYRKHKKAYRRASAKGIKCGGYTLALIKDYKPLHTPWANSAYGKDSIIRCLSTDWSRKYWKKILRFQKETMAKIIEIDGPYHFNVCNGGETHHHKGANDSRYAQWKESTVEIFRDLKALGIFINAPDWLYLSGSNRCGIGYEEIAYSQPRQEQLIASRIYGYKGTFKKYGSMSYGFLPLEQYHGGGEQAVFSPLTKNLFDYEWAVAQSMISGIIPCFRGRKLFDSDESRIMIKKWVNFYRKYQKVINGNTIHFLPPVIDPSKPSRTTDIDAIFNVVNKGETRGILGLFNQTDKTITKEIRLPLFYTGLTGLQSPPPPPAGTGITEVKHPVYGQYPPIYPVNPEEADEIVSGFVGWEGEKALVETIDDNLSHLEPYGERVVQEKSVVISREDQSPVKYKIESDGSAVLIVTMKAMSYSWYAIKGVDNE